MIPICPYCRAMLNGARAPITSIFVCRNCGVLARRQVLWNLVNAAEKDEEEVSYFEK